MSKLEVDKIDPQSGTNLELGTSGDTITIPAGVTFDSSAATNTLPSTVVTTTGTQTLTNKSIAATQLTGTITPSDSTVSLAKLTATGTKDATTFLRGDNTFAAAGLDGWSSSSGNLLPADAAKGIYLGVNSATAANLLNDYEEGTFTPSFNGTTGAPSGVNYASRLGNYTKIGRIVHVDIWLNLSSWSSAPSGVATINGLPFTSKSDGSGNYYASSSIGYSLLFDADNAPKGGYVASAVTRIVLRKSSSSDARDNIGGLVSAPDMNGTEDIMISLTYQTD